MKVVYFLYRKGGEGAVAKAGGIKLSEGCLLVPNNASDDIIGMLNAFGVNVEKLEIYLSEDYVKSLLGQRQIIARKSQDI